MRAPRWYPPLIAHRGAGKDLPENTLESMQLGASYGFQMLELDVQATADGELVLMHDETLDRTTTGTGLLVEHTWAELSQLAIRPPMAIANWEGKIPQLTTIHEWAMSLGIGLNIELKSHPSVLIKTTECLAAWLETHYTASVDFPIVVSSFQLEGLQLLQQRVPQVARASLFEHWEDAQIQQSLDLACEAVHYHASVLTPDRVARLKQHGFRIWSFTVNEVQQARSLLEWGVDGICTDYMQMPAEMLL